MSFAHTLRHFFGKGISGSEIVWFALGVAAGRGASVCLFVCLPPQDGLKQSRCPGLKLITEVV